MWPRPRPYDLGLGRLASLNISGCDYTVALLRYSECALCVSSMYKKLSYRRGICAIFHDLWELLRFQTAKAVVPIDLHCTQCRLTVCCDC